MKRFTVKLQNLKAMKMGTLTGRASGKSLQKIKNRSLDKVAIASEMCLAIRNLSDKLEFDLEDTAYYLIDAINHVCR